MFFKNLNVKGYVLQSSTNVEQIKSKLSGDWTVIMSSKNLKKGSLPGRKDDCA